MKKWTAICAVVGGLYAAAGFAQEQALEAKASFIFNGEQIQISRDTESAPKQAATFAAISGTCGAPCIAPMEVAQGVPTFGETEVLTFLVKEVANSTGLLVDARMPNDRAQGFIPGSVNLPYATLDTGAAFLGEIFNALGVRELEGFYNFTDAQSLLVYDTGPSTDDAGRLINGLLAAGYPAEKIKYYRGGMQVWAVLGFSIEGSGS
jgi:rhodanese-related sulfurtransferase